MDFSCPALPYSFIEMLHTKSALYNHFTLKSTLQNYFILAGPEPCSMQWVAADADSGLPKSYKSENGIHFCKKINLQTRFLLAGLFLGIFPHISLLFSFYFMLAGLF
jgi:hypothetical protein